MGGVVRPRRLAASPSRARASAVGVVFGATQSAIAAQFENSGRTELTGLVYGCLGVGSALSGLAVTRLPARVPLPSRLVGFGATLGLTALLLQVAASPVAQAAACLVVGWSVSPALATAYVLTERAVPARAATLAMATLSTVTAAGVGVGTAIAGQLVDEGSVRAALVLPAVAGVLVMFCGLAAYGQARRPASLLP
ncbi:MAG: hypothetical protein ACRDPJ_07560 [Nocardioidaceae bacterium]